MSLHSVWKKLKVDRSLVIGYLGGSVTEGAGASHAQETSWRAHTTKWLRQRYNCPLVEINAAIGGTGSDLAAFRCRRDLLDKNPDLVFVEFAINDDSSMADMVVRSMEGVVRQIWKKNAMTEIIFVYTLWKPDAENYYAKGFLPPGVELHQKVAEYYHIPSINAGKALCEYIHKEDGVWEKYMTDSAHPSDEGHAVYSQEVCRFLEEHLDDTAPTGVRRLPQPIYYNTLENGHLVDAWLIGPEGWVKENESLSNRYPHRIACNIPGTELVFRFTGTAIGVYWLKAPDSGDIEWSIDNGRMGCASSWDKYAMSFTRAHYLIFDSDLPYGEHVLRITVSKTRQPQSEGHWIRIGAFLVG